MSSRMLLLTKYFCREVTEKCQPAYIIKYREGDCYYDLPISSDG